jgi:hypothetical protein
MSNRKSESSATSQRAPAHAMSRRLAAAMLVPAFALSACYVIPVGPEGEAVYTLGVPYVPPRSATGAPSGPFPMGPMPAVLNVKLYPANDLANQTGVLTGQVTNMMTGKGRFTFNYQGETLVGEATRVANDERRGVASAYGQRGTFARCEYQMSSPRMGAGTCSFSNGAEYQVHIGG